VDGTRGTVQIERGIASGKHGYQVLFTNENGQCQTTFYPFCGVNEELKAFVHDIVQANKVLLLILINFNFYFFFDASWNNDLDILGFPLRTYYDTI
jgi:hypothetical protein